MRAIIPIVRKVDIVYGPLVDAQEFPEDVDVTLVEGAISTQEDVERLQQIRARSKMLVSLGDCAVTGNVAAMRNVFPVNKLLQRIYVEGADAGPRCSPRRAAAIVEAGAPRPGLRKGRRLPPRLSASEQSDCRVPEQPAGGPQARGEPEDQVRVNERPLSPRKHGKHGRRKENN